MGVRKLRDREVRKLQTTGEDGQSYMITLPKELVESLGWRKNHKLTVHKYGKKLIVQDWK